MVRTTNNKTLGENNKQKTLPKTKKPWKSKTFFEKKKKLGDKSTKTNLAEKKTRKT